MISALVPIVLLLQSLVTVLALPTCSQLFTSIVVSQTEMTAKIQLSPINPDSDQFHLNIRIAVLSAVNKENIGRVKLEKSKEETLDEVESTNSISYNVHLPTQQYISYVSSITLNDRNYCTGSSLITFAHVTLVELEHILFAEYSGPNRLYKKWLENSDSRIRPMNPYLRLIGMGMRLGFLQPQEEPSFPMRNSIPLSGSSDTTVKVTTEATVKVTPVTSKVITETWATTNTTTECGRRANVEFVVPLISLGRETAPGEWPWLVAIFVVKKKHDFQCAGSLVTNRHVITAAHCLRMRHSLYNLPASTLEVALGRYQLRNWREEGSVNRYVQSYSIHPDYAFGISSDSDIAILFLWTPVEFSVTIRPICLWSGPIELEHVVNAIGYVVGWGRDELGNPYVEMPRMSNAPIVSQTDCLFSNEGFIKFTSNRTFCAGLQDDSGPCNGDSGSGFVIFDARNDRYQLRGIVSQSLSSSSSTCDLSNYVVYVDVAKYMNWINKKISLT